MTDFEEKLGNGDRRAFEQLVRDNQNKIYAVCLNMLKNIHDAQDAAQETFIKAYGNISSFAGASKVETWLTRIAVNTCFDMIKKRETHLNIDDSFDIAADETTESQAVKHENIAEVRRALESLPPELRAIIVLRDIEGHSYDEIADILSLNPGTVRSRIFRAREKLKDFLARDGELF